MMCSVQINLTTFIILLCITKNLVTCCDFTFSYKDNEIKFNYVAYEDINKETGGCITPSTTVLDNPYAGYVHQMKINNLNIPVLLKEFIANFSRVTTIEMKNSRITTIKTNAFSNLLELLNMDLSGNKIKFIEDNIFFKTPNLNILSLNKNQLTNFRQESLRGLQKLTHLNLSYNSIESITKNSFTILLRLQTIDLSHNRIINLDQKGFEGVSLLINLDLSYNRINHIEDKIFQPLRGLNVLNLFNNNLTYISREVLEDLILVRELIILFNPLQCKCYDIINKWAAENGVGIKNKGLECNKIKNLDSIPVCITTSETECVVDIKEDLYEILHSENIDYECYLKLDLKKSLESS